MIYTKYIENYLIEILSLYFNDEDIDDIKKMIFSLNDVKMKNLIFITLIKTKDLQITINILLNAIERL